LFVRFRAIAEFRGQSTFFVEIQALKDTRLHFFATETAPPGKSFRNHHSPIPTCVRGGSSKQSGVPGTTIFQRLGSDTNTAYAAVKPSPPPLWFLSHRV
jgi:hypothetical protein